MNNYIFPLYVKTMQSSTAYLVEWQPAFHFCNTPLRFDDKTMPRQLIDPSKSKTKRIFAPCGMFDFSFRMTTNDFLIPVSESCK
jgi:hypothetical protein